MNEKEIKAMVEIIKQQNLITCINLTTAVFNILTSICMLINVTKI